MSNIAALIGQTQRPEEQRMAEALRGEQRQGDFLSMSTLQPIAQMGQTMNTRAADAAKTMGGLVKARKEREAQAAEYQAAREARIEAARILEENTNRRHLENLSVRQGELDRKTQYDLVKERQADEKQELNRLKRDDTVDKWERDFGLDTDKFLFNVQQTGIDNEFRSAEAAEDIRQFDASLGFDYDRLNQNNEQFKTTNDLSRDRLNARIAHWSEQLGYYKARDAADRFQKEDHFVKEMAENVRQFAKRHGLNEELAAIKLFSAKSMADWRKEKLFFDITGDTGSADYGNMTKVGSRERIKTEEVADAAKSIFPLIDSFDDEYANVTGLPFAGAMAMSAVAGAPILKGAVGALTGKDGETVSDASTWWSMYGNLYELPERNRLFGAALTEQEQRSWKANNINPNMDEEDIRKRLQNLAWIVRRAAEREAKVGHSKGMGKDFLLETFGFLGDTEHGKTNYFEDLQAEKKAEENAVGGLTPEEAKELEELEAWEAANQ